MKKLVSVVSAAVVIGALASAPANAWWGGPGGWGNGGGPWQAFSDAFGGGDVNFNARSYGRGNGYGYGAPYYGYGYGYPGAWGGYPYGGVPGYGFPGYGAPVAPPAPPTGK